MPSTRVLPEDPPQVTIAGAGIAGLALAGLLGSRGLRVLQIDWSPLPRDKVCGEGIMPLGMSVLSALGIDPQALPGRDFQGLEFHTPRRAAIVPFDSGHGRGIRRTALIQALANRVAALPNVATVQDVIHEPLLSGGRVVGFRGTRSDYRGQVCVAADGVRSRLLARLGVEIQPRGYRMGLRQHFELRGPLEMPRVKVGLFAPYDVYLTPVNERELLATTMCDREAYRRIAGDYPGFLASTPFGPLFRGTRAASRRLGWHHPLFRPRRFVTGGLYAVGDAGGGIDPCLGMGMSLALASTQMAAQAIAAGFADPARRPEAERDYESWRQGLFRRYGLFDTLFRYLVTSQAGSEWLVWGMRHWPETAQAITGIVAHSRPWRTFPWTSLLRAQVGPGPGTGTAGRRSPPEGKDSSWEQE